MACGSTCAPGQIACTTGAPVCQVTNAAVGTGCGSNMVCNGSGTCVAKTADGAMCTVSAQCQNANCSKYAATGASLCCATGSSNCGSCVATQSDNNNCGTCGTKCGPNTSCQSGGCACKGGSTNTLMCGTCGLWAFDSGTAEGWVQDTNPASPVNGGANSAVQLVANSTNNKQAGAGSLAVKVLVPITMSSEVVSIAVPICGNTTMNLAGTTMSAWLYFDGPAFTVEPWVIFDAWGPNSDLAHAVEVGTSIPVMTWHQVSVAFDAMVNANHVAIQLLTNEGWNGTMYVDGVTLTPP